MAAHRSLRSGGSGAKLAAILAFSVFALAAQRSDATITAAWTSGSGTLAVTATSTENAIVSSDGTNATVTSQAGVVTITGGPAAASAVKVITVIQSTTNNRVNTFDLSGVTTANGFTNPPACLIKGSGGADTIVGSDFNDSIMGEAQADIINGGAGNDTIDGGDGADTLTGGTGSDTIYGGQGNDNLNVGTWGAGETEVWKGDEGAIILVDGNDLFNATVPPSGCTLNIDGDGPAVPTGDTLSYDVAGHTYSDSGSAVTITDGSFGTVNYVNIETKAFPNAPVPSLTSVVYPSNGAVPAKLLCSPAGGVGQPGSGKVTIGNIGLVALSVSAVTFLNDPSGYFQFAGGNPGAFVVPAGGSSALTVLFNPGAVLIPEQESVLRITSDTGGTPGAQTLVGIKGSSQLTDLVWTAGRSTHFRDFKNWTPEGKYTFPWTNLVINGTTAQDATTTENLTLGLNAAAKMTVSAGTMSVTTNKALNLQNRGELIQSGGSLNIADNVSVSSSSNADASCTYTLSGTGVLALTGSASELKAGGSGPGWFLMSAGTVTGKRLTMANNAAPAYGEARISGGTVTLTGTGTNGRVSVGKNGPGVLKISGTASIIAPALMFGETGGTGSCEMSGGTVTVDSVSTGTGALTAFNLTGGTLKTGNLFAGADLAIPFSWTGGNLMVKGTSGLSLTVPAGSTFAPGASVGTATFSGGAGFTMGGSSSLEIEVASASSADKIVMGTGTATLGGTLNVVLLGIYVPPPGGMTEEAWDIVVGTHSGTFATTNFPALPEGQTMSVDYTDPTKVTLRVSDPHTGVEDWKKY